MQAACGLLVIKLMSLQLAAATCDLVLLQKVHEVHGATGQHQMGNSAALHREQGKLHIL